jgi:hypothetical protein
VRPDQHPDQCTQRRPARRWPSCRALLWALGLACTAAGAEDTDPALAGFRKRPAPAVREAPPDALEWERRLRVSNSFGPPDLRPVDAALLTAARQARWTDVQQLLKSAGAQANARDALGGHVLVLAARAGQDALLRDMLQRGAEIDRVGEDGFTALGAAAFAGRRSTVRLLLLAGAEPQRWGASGQTALHLATVAGHVDVVEELLRLRVDVDLLNRQRESALDVAASVAQDQVMAVLMRAGADTTQAGMR